MLSTTFVITRRSTVGTDPLSADATGGPVRGAPPTAKVPVAMAPSLRNSRRLMAPSLGRGSFPEERLRLLELWPLRVGLGGEAHELSAVGAGLLTVAGAFRRAGRPVNPVEPIGFSPRPRIEPL